MTRQSGLLAALIMACTSLPGCVSVARTPEDTAAKPSRPRMSFNRQCNRLVTDLPAAQRGKLVPPRSSKATPLQQPPLPPGARSRGEEGTVVLEVFVTEIGDVADVRVETSSGYEELDTAAMAITEHWKLTPAFAGDTPVCMWGKFAVVFSLKAPMPRQDSRPLVPVRPTLNDR